MLSAAVITAFRVLTWTCICLLAILSLLPAEELVRTGISGELEHFAAYAATASVATVAYGRSYSGTRIIGLIWAYAGILECLQHFSPGRHPAMGDFAASGSGAWCGGIAVVFVTRRLGADGHHGNRRT
jgi:VanZ family protein